MKECEVCKKSKEYVERLPNYVVSETYDENMVKEVNRLVDKQIELSVTYSSYLRPINVQKLKNRASKLTKK